MMSENIKSHICDKCGKRLSSYKNLWRHKKTVHVQKKTFPRKDIPTFNGSDFLGGNPPKETMEKLENHIKNEGTGYK